MRPSADLQTLRDHARARATWAPSANLCDACRPISASKAALLRTLQLDTPATNHVDCEGRECGCTCRELSDSDRALWTQIADELDAYLTPNDEQEALL